MRAVALQAEAEGCIDPMYQLLNQMFKYLCRNDHCHLICWLVLSYLFVEYSIIYGEIPGGSSANATSNWICWFLKVRWKPSIIITQLRWWWHQVALHFKCKNLYLLIIAVCHHCGRWVNKTVKNHNVHFQPCQWSNVVSEKKKKGFIFPNQRVAGEKNFREAWLGKHQEIVWVILLKKWLTDELWGWVLLFLLLAE